MTPAAVGWLTANVHHRAGRHVTTLPHSEALHMLGAADRQIAHGQAVPSDEEISECAGAYHQRMVQLVTPQGVK